MLVKYRILAGVICLAAVGIGHAQGGEAPRLTVKQIMNALVVPGSNAIWAAYQLQSDGDWLAVENAALSVIAAGELLSRGGAGDGEAETAAEPDWKTYNGQLLAAARRVLDAVAARDEDALSAAGNDALYPPCESCHQTYQVR